MKHNWIIKFLPANHQDLIYLEISKIGLLFMKPPSKEEAINASDAKILRNMRDKKEFVDYVQKIDSRFLKTALNRKTFVNELDEAINQFIISHMSNWATIVKKLPEKAKRLNQVSIFDTKIPELIEIYNKPEVFLFTDYYSEELKKFRGKVMFHGEIKGWRQEKHKNEIISMNYLNKS